eukprot:CAMPEP_0183778346 /NCGR_PEP_ID=MMETSP0739-20130205/51209_1 /TAXON_ID=385413 /ORGANISM="Thalassiosira miniscula, Strain CCMP1093" /LENGTH=34 /DNA_ID= /DNA_START= /DNA_END= /DNA_ORIENTATION=
MTSMDDPPERRAAIPTRGPFPSPAPVPSDANKGP